MTVKFADVCCGCGGLSLGLKKAGMKPSLAVDIDAEAVKIYRRNVDEQARVLDIQSTKLYKSQVDVLVGGLPCQGFSTIGKRDPNDERNGLWEEFVRLLREGLPTAFLIENVPGFMRTQHFEEFLSKTKHIGYIVTAAVLNALDYGVAQNRKRAVIIGSLKGTPELPRPNGGPKTLREAIGNLPLEPDGKNDHCKKIISKRSLERYKYVRPGGDFKDLPEDLKNPCWRKLKRSNGSFGRLEWDKASVTIRSTFIRPECGRFIHPEADRPLTVREGARLQSFPDGFVFSGSLRTKTRVIGNAVPPTFAKALGKSILNSAL